MRYGHFVPEADEIDADTYPDMVEASNYYRTPRVSHPNSCNRYRFTGHAYRMAFDAYAQIPDYLRRPLLAVGGSEAGSLWQIRLGYELSNGPKELFIVDGQATSIYTTILNILNWYWTEWLVSLIGTFQNNNGYRLPEEGRLAQDRAAHGLPTAE